MVRKLAILLLLFVCAPLFANDLTVGWISRLPEIDYVWNSSNPRIEGWPATGSTVTWRANVQSRFSQPQQIAYVWRLDGVEISRGTATLAPNGTTFVDLPRVWTFERHRLSIEIDPANQVIEQSENNNSLEIDTDALSVGIWVEQDIYDWFREHQKDLRTGSTSFENWAQRFITLYNDMAAMAIYDETPNGVIDRWRVQKIVVVPNDALPLVPPPDLATRNGEPNGSTHPNMTDRSVDLQIGFQTRRLFDYLDTTTVSITNPFYIAPAMIHELGHARYLTDVYAFSVGHQPPVRTIDTPGVPQLLDVYRTPEQGLMNRDYTFIDRYSAIALNRIAGARATVGNYNDPDNVGSFLNDLPAENRLTIRDVDGALMSNARVEIYQPIPFETSAWYAAHWDATPDIVLETDANGQVLVGRCPFSSDGKVINWWRGSTTTVIVRVEKDSVVRFGYLESRLFNLAYWRGNPFFADHELVVGASYCANRGPVLVTRFDATVYGSPVSLKWNRVDGTSGYRVYTQTPGEKPQLRGATTETEITIPLHHGRTYWWVEASFPQCPAMRSDLGWLTVRPLAKRRAVR